MHRVHRYSPTGESLSRLISQTTPFPAKTHNDLRSLCRVWRTQGSAERPAFHKVSAQPSSRTAMSHRPPADGSPICAPLSSTQEISPREVLPKSRNISPGERQISPPSFDFDTPSPLSDATIYFGKTLCTHFHILLWHRLFYLPSCDVTG